MRSQVGVRNTLVTEKGGIVQVDQEWDGDGHDVIRCVDQRGYIHIPKSGRPTSSPSILLLSFSVDCDLATYLPRRR